MSVQIESKAPVVPDWTTWLANGEQYYRAACPEGRKSRFLPELQYNLLSMSLEGYVMAIADVNGTLPYNHTYTDLMETLETLVPLDPDLKAVILKHERLQELCSLDDYHRSTPSEADLAELRSAVDRIGALARTACPKI